MKASTKEEIVNQVVEEIYNAYPNLWEKFGENGHKRTIEDNFHHLNHLETACELDDEKYFTDYTKWLESVLTSRNVGTHLIIDNFERLIEAIPGKVEKDDEKKYLHFLKKGIAVLKVT